MATGEWAADRAEGILHFYKQPVYKRLWSFARGFWDIYAMGGIQFFRGFLLLWAKFPFRGENWALGNDSVKFEYFPDIY